MKGVIISIFVALAVVLMVEQGHAAINCRIVDAGLLPCVPYLTQGGSPSTPCCIGVESIKTMTITTEDKRAACNCVKTAAQRYPSLKDEAAQTLPEKCRVKLDIPISRTTNCDA